MDQEDPLDIAIGARVRTIRESRKITQAGLGKALGVTFQQVQKYEKGVNRMSGSTLIRCAEALDTSVAALCGEKDEAPEAVPLMREYAALDAAQRQAVLNLIRVMTRP